MTKSNDHPNKSRPSKFKNLVDFENYLKSLSHEKLLEEVNRIITLKDKEFVEHYFRAYDKSVIVKDEK